MKNKLEGCVNFAFLSTATIVSCAIIINAVINLTVAPDRLSPSDVPSAAGSAILLGMIIFTLLHPHK